MVRNARSGMTLVEAVLSMALFAPLMLAFTHVLRVDDASNSLQVEEAVQVTDLHESLQEIAEDLAYSGFSDDGTYPYLFPAGDPAASFADHAHDEPELPVGVGDPNSQEVVFLLPADDNGDSRPDMDSGGDLLWGSSEFSYVILRDANGMNRVERRTDGGSGRVLCRNVESLVVDDTESGGLAVPLGCLRVRMTVSKVVGGRRLSSTGEVTVRLRNGGMRP